MRRLHRITALALLIAYVPACHTWRLESVRPADVIAAQSPSQVRVTLMSGKQLVLRQPVVVSDSLAGRSRRDTVAIPLREVVALETRQTKGAVTGLTILGGVLGGLALLFGIGCAASDCSLN
jgi:hypothetical protein